MVKNKWGFATLKIPEKADEANKSGTKGRLKLGDQLGKVQGSRLTGSYKRRMNPSVGD